MSSHPIWRKARMPPRISEVLETRASLVCKHFLSKLDDLEEKTQQWGDMPNFGPTHWGLTNQFVGILWDSMGFFRNNLGLKNSFVLKNQGIFQILWQFECNKYCEQKLLGFFPINLPSWYTKIKKHSSPVEQKGSAENLQRCPAPKMFLTFLQKRISNDHLNELGCNNQ